MLLSLASMQYSRHMPKLYFWEPENQSHGILRAVLPWEDCDHVVDSVSAIHVGNEFPRRSINRSGQTTVAILYVCPEEANERWFAGFYLLKKDVTDINEALRILNRLPAIVSPQMTRS